MMDHSFAAEQNQTVNTEKLGILAAFFSECKVGSLLNKSGISKTKMENIKFIDALKRILQMAMAAIRGIKAVSEEIVQSMLDAIMVSAIIFFGLSENKSSLISRS